MNEYDVNIYFDEFMGNEKCYTVVAESVEEAKAMAIKMAMEDLQIVDVICVGGAV